jgi:hypothetical protein
VSRVRVIRSIRNNSGEWRGHSGFPKSQSPYKLGSAISQALLVPPTGPRLSVGACNLQEYNNFKIVIAAIRDNKIA